MCVEGFDLYRVGVDIVNVWAELPEELRIVVENFVRGGCLWCLLGFECGVLIFCMGLGVSSGVVYGESVIISG